MAVLDKDLCKPSRCGQECLRFCPGVKIGEKTVELDPLNNRPVIHEGLCTGCGICVKKCPYGALWVVNLPEELGKECSFSYGVNAFRLYRLPIPRKGSILGLIGQNGVGKTTALRILAGELRPNLGRYDKPPSWREVIDHYKGSELQAYLDKLSKKEVKAVHKPQYVDLIPKYVRGEVRALLSKVDERGSFKEVVETLELEEVLDREVHKLSGGELQRVAIAACLLRDADVYLIDEPSSYLDVRQRIKAARAIRRLTEADKIIVVVEHDLAVLDYLSDYVCILYGKPGVYGVVSHPYSVRLGINLYLDGYLPDENLRLRKEPVRFRARPEPFEKPRGPLLIKWSSMSKSLGGFQLRVKEGEVHEGEVLCALGPNGIGKTTFVKLLAGLIEPDEGCSLRGKGNLRISYKPQYLTDLGYEGKVEEVLEEKVGSTLHSSWFQVEVAEPLGIHELMEKDVSELSGGELQRVAIAACLGMEAELYLVDEASAYLDVEQRLAMAKAVRKSVEIKKAAAIVVEHDVMIADAIADRVLLFSGEPTKLGEALEPMGLRKAFNLFLKKLDVTFRRDPQTGRARVNKPGSYLDRAQKAMGEYYYV
ncbi:MAG: ribosome biogenesis/translation initiation ATPase RLI [Candidatus Nezhaarchaeota archaeon]|nr:ribosome biogenesis/translation initiation ATPase RLI [Candidatus Nezhaarchaeota archaeon]